MAGLIDGTAFAGVALLALVAPFETTAPLLRLPGQSISNVEACLLLAFAAWGLAIVASRRLPVWRTSFTWPWTALVAAMLLSAALSPVSRSNALHMTGRVAAAFGIYLVAVNGLTTGRRVRAVITVALVSGVAVSALALLEYLRVGLVLDALRAFRPGLAWVGAQLRAGGPLQYPTIASMYLEVVFACGLGLLLHHVAATGGVRRKWRVGVLFAALLLVADGIALTYTRAGLISIAASLLVAWPARRRSIGFDGGRRALAALAAGIVLVVAASRSPQSLFLRFTSESQESWYRATIDAPLSVVFDAGSVTMIPVSVTNAGRLTWDSHADPPILLAYHWLAADSDRVVAYEGIRTPFPAPVGEGETVAVSARVSAPRQAGSYRIAWDVVQEHRLWFTTEPGAIASVSNAVVRGMAGAIATSAPPLITVRPGRLVLWSAAAKMFAAHPLFGVGPDNFRLAYGEYADLPVADPRVHSNSMYIELAAGGGIVVFAVFAWLLRSAAGCVAALLRRVTAQDAAIGAGIAAAMAAIAIHGLVDSFLTFTPTYVLFAVVMGSGARIADCGLTSPIVNNADRI
ncbi:MAG TPA: O-antigen ligase family protein [Vicinamibacterales bacterium]|nr:O-antigen ligase family protein [Vicinamibacterales bacterium]